MLVEFMVVNLWDILIYIGLFLLIVIPYFPPRWAGLNNEWYHIESREWKKQRKFNFIELIIHLFSSSLFTGPALTMGLRGTTTLILFIVIGTDLYINGQISNNAVTISIIAITALYLEKFLDTADEITVWKLFIWKSKKPYINPQTTPVSEQDNEKINQVEEL